MELFSINRLSKLDVKWAGKLDKTTQLGTYEHTNPYFQLIVVTNGPVCLQVEEHKLEFASGDCFLLKPWERHQGWEKKEREMEFFWVQFTVNPLPVSFDSRTMLDDSLNIIHLEKQDLRTAEQMDADAIILPRRFQPAQKYELFALFEKLLYQVNHPRGYYRFRCTLLLGQIMELIAEDILDQNRLNSPVPVTFMTYREIVSFLNENYQNSLSGEIFESNFEYKYEYLCQIFKKYAGVSIVTYIHQLRIQRAKHLLGSSRKSIKEIAIEVGFEDPYYFSKLFKRMEQASPSDYRNQGRITPV